MTSSLARTSSTDDAERSTYVFNWESTRGLQIECYKRRRRTIIDIQKVVFQEWEPREVMGGEFDHGAED